MATVQGSIVINNQFSNTLNQLNSGLKDSMNKFNQFKQSMSQGSGGNFASKFRTGFNQINSDTQKTGGLFKSMLGANIVGAGITKGMGMATSGIHSMIGELDGSSKAWQTFNGNMKQMGANNSVINSARDSMQDYATKTIYSASDMASTYSQLAAVGTKNTGELVKGFGGLAAASEDPAQAMKTLSQQATQMAAMPKVQWADFKLMLQQTPAGIASVAKTMHKSSGELVRDIQAGKVKTQDFFNAIAKTGNSANFTKMATQFKTVGQAADGLKENLAIKLLPTYEAVSKVGIKALSDLANKISGMDFSGLQSKAVAAANGIVSGLKSAANFASQFWQALSNTSAFSAASTALQALGGAIKNIANAFTGGNGIDSLATSLGKLAGSAITGAANTITSISNAIKQMSPGQIKAIAIAIGSLAASFKVIGAVKGGMDLASKLGLGKISGAVKTAIGSVKTAFSGGGILAAVKAGFSGIGSVISTAFAPVVIVVAAVTAAIAAAVAAWSSNFMNIRGVIQGLMPIFGIVGSTIKSAFGNIGSSLAPLAPVIKGIGVLIIGVVAVGFVAAASAALVLVAAIQLVAGVIGAVIHTAMALGDVLHGDFSGAGKEMSKAGQSIANGWDGAKKSIGGVKDILGTVKDSLGQLGKKDTKINVKADTSGVTSGVNNAVASTKGKSGTVKVKGDVTPFTNSMNLATGSKKSSTVAVKGDTSQLTNSMNLATGSKKSSTVAVKGDTSQLTNSLQTATAAKKDTTVKVNADTTQLTNSMNLAMPANKTSKTVKVDADTTAAKQKTDALTKQPVKGSTVKYDSKVTKPKVPQPDKPKVGTIAAPKVGKPKTPQPSKPKASAIAAPKVGQPKTPTPTKVKAPAVAAPKVGKPRIPQPARITVPALAAPKVRRPSMAPVVSAVRSGMAQAVSAVRYGGSQMASAVRSAVNSAAAAARSGAGAMRSAGSMIGAGLAAGMRSQVGAVASAANALVAQANRAARAAAKVHSPSRLFAEIGDYMGQGMAVGMDGTNALVASAAADGASGQIPSVSVGDPERRGIPSSTSFNQQGAGSQMNTTNNSQDSSSTMSVIVEAGAIQVISSGDGSIDGETIARELENYLIRQDGKSMS